MTTLFPLQTGIMGHISYPWQDATSGLCSHMLFVIKKQNNVAEYLLKYPETTGGNDSSIMPAIFPIFLLTITSSY